MAGTGTAHLRDTDVLSAALYPKVFAEYREFRERFSDVAVLPTRLFLAPLEIDEEVSVEIERGKTLIIKLRAVGQLDPDGTRLVYFELNGRPRSIRVLCGRINSGFSRASLSVSLSQLSAWASSRAREG